MKEYSFKVGDDTYKVLVRPDGGQEYYLNGERHREDGPAVVYPGGYQVYYLDGKLHREDGPAVACSNGHQCYWRNGKLHREDGPAVVFPDGRQEYYLNGKKVTKEEVMGKSSCAGRTVTIDGVEYTLTPKKG